MSLSSIVEEKLITGEALLEMTDLDLCELVEGRIMPMSPTGSEHGFIEFRIAKCLDLFVESGKLGFYKTQSGFGARGGRCIYLEKKTLAKTSKRIPRRRAGISY